MRIENYQHTALAGAFWYYYPVFDDIKGCQIYRAWELQAQLQRELQSYSGARPSKRR